MRVVLQRVTQATVTTQPSNEESSRHIGHGLCILLGIARDDTEEDLHYLCKKILHLRIFSDTQDKMNQSIQDIHGEILVVSQFTLYADTKRGNRPSFSANAPPAKAHALYLHFVEILQNALKKPIVTGFFQEHMHLSLTNDGPVTICLDSRIR